MNITQKSSRMREILCVCIVIILLIGISANMTHALTPSTISSDDQRNKIAKNWTYYGRGYYEQNCLSFALGRDPSEWTWPNSWGNSPSVSTVQSWLKTNTPYKTFYSSGLSGPINPWYIAAYTLNGGVTHFSHHTGSGYTVRAKWGHLEIFTHSTNNPYTNNAYGQVSFIAYK